MLEHNSVLRPLYVAEQSGTIKVTYVPFDAQTGYLNPQEIEDAIRPNTKFMVITHCSNVLGTVQPLAQIGTICKKHGVLLVVDGSQGAGYNEVDMLGWNIDCYIFTGHKGLLGPTGIGGSYVREGLHIAFTRAGGTGVRSAYPAHLEEYPYRLEYGTPNLLGIIGLHAGVKWVTKEGISLLHDREMGLWERLRAAFAEIKGITMYCAQGKENHNPVLSFNIAGWEAGDVGTMLDVDYNIAVRTGLQCAPKVHQQIGTLEKHGTVRMSIGPFTTETEIDTAIEAVREIAAIKN
jgi:selenocysteine lyase/cysteine desulfurase